MQPLSPDQISQLHTLGIKSDTAVLPTKKGPPILPLLSISGLTLISLGGLFLLKSQQTVPTNEPIAPIRSPQDIGGPTQVPKSIQHYLLTSQQQFTQALQYQTSNPAKAVELVNHSIIAASEAIKYFPNDYRGYEQRGRIYHSILDSQPQFLDPSINDFSTATKLNPSSAEITRSLATLFARKGDAQSTLLLLAQTITLEPTKAQNFYDLARIQQQAGLLPEALLTYDRLLTLVSDPTQKQQVASEKTAIEKLVSQNQTPLNTPAPIKKSPTTPLNLPDSPSLIKAELPAGEGNDTGLIIAAPETSKNISVSNLTDSNALSGTSTLPADISQISISNSNLTSTSQVYITITKGGKNQSLQVLSKSKDSFVVGLNSPIPEPIEFKWWIINQ